MKKYLGLISALVVAAFVFIPLVQVRAQDTRDAKDPKIISKEEAAKKVSATKRKRLPDGRRFGTYQRWCRRWKHLGLHQKSILEQRLRLSQGKGPSRRPDFG